MKYNDPIYVKLEKLDIMIRLASQANIAQVLSELKEYATEVDVDFVRKAVRAIGRCAIKVEPSAERCVSTLLDLIQTKVNYVVQEAIVVIKDIFRSVFPTRSYKICISCSFSTQNRAAFLKTLSKRANLISLQHKFTFKYISRPFSFNNK